MVSISTVALIEPWGTPTYSSEKVKTSFQRRASQVALQLREVVVGPAAARKQLLGVVEEVQPEVEQAAGDRLAVHLLDDARRGASRAARTSSVATSSLSS